MGEGIRCAGAAQSLRFHSSHFPPFGVKYRLVVDLYEPERDVREFALSREAHALLRERLFTGNSYSPWFEFEAEPNHLGCGPGWLITLLVLYKNERMKP